MNEISYIFRISQMNIRELIREVVYTASIHTLDGMFMHEESNRELLERIDLMEKEIETLREEV